MNLKRNLITAGILCLFLLLNRAILTAGAEEQAIMAGRIMNADVYDNKNNLIGEVDTSSSGEADR